MAGAKFCWVIFDEISKIIPLKPGDARDSLISSLNIVLNANEDIIISDQQTGALIDSNNLYDLISSLQRPTDMKFFLQSRFRSIQTDFFLNIYLFTEFSTDISVGVVEESPNPVITWPIFSDNVINTSEENENMDETCDDIQIVESTSTAPERNVSNEVYHFGSFDRLRTFLNQNVPGLITMYSKVALSDGDRVLVSKEVIQHILDSFPSLT